MDFLQGSTTAISAIGSITAGTSATFASLSLFFTLMGIPIVFYIGYLLGDFIKYTVIGGRTSIISSKISFLDHVPFVKPYKGYNRLKSKQWNIENTLN